MNVYPVHANTDAKTLKDLMFVLVVKDLKKLIVIPNRSNAQVSVNVP